MKLLQFPGKSPAQLKLAPLSLSNGYTIYFDANKDAWRVVRKVEGPWDTFFSCKTGPAAQAWERLRAHVGAK